MAFLAGQAEKVYLGTCNACMVRIANDKDQVEAAKNIAKISGLKVTIVDQELWLHKNRLIWLDGEYNSPQYHFNRGTDCGLPAMEIDLHFHITTGTEVIDCVRNGTSAFSN